MCQRGPGLLPRGRAKAKAPRAFGLAHFGAMARCVKTVLHLITLATLASAVPVVAQNSTPAQTIPGLDDFDLPSSRPTPRAPPSPEPTTNPRPAASATSAGVEPPRPAPTIRATPTPVPTRAPAPRSSTAPLATPTPRALPSALPAAPIVATPRRPVAPQTAAATSAGPLPQPSSGPVAIKTPEARLATPPEAAHDATAWPWLAAGGLLSILALIGAGLWWRRLRTDDVPEPRRATSHEIFLLDPAGPPGDLAPETDFAPAPIPVAPPAAISVAQPTQRPEAPAEPLARAQLTLAFTPKRAGTNLLSAAVEYLVTIRNTGAASATGIRLDIRLLGAGRQQQALVETLFAGPIAQPITAPFDLAPDSIAELGGMAMHPKDTIEVIEANGRTLFIPVIAVNLRYGWDGGDGQTAHAYVVGIDRGPDAKFAPFRLDGPPRMHNQVASAAV